MDVNILQATYSSQDLAFAFQHPKWTVWQRDLARSGSLALPRKASTGPGGGEWRYAHVVERGILNALLHRKGSGRSVVSGLIRLLMGNDYGLKKINALDDDTRSAVFCGSSGWNADQFPEGTPHDFAQVVDFPVFYFGEDFISRDPSKPTYLIYDPTPDLFRPAEVALVGDMSISEAYDLVIEMRTKNVAPDDERFKQIIIDDADDLPIINMTSMLSRLDRRLDLRLKASVIRGS